MEHRSTAQAEVFLKIKGSLAVREMENDLDMPIENA